MKNFLMYFTICLLIGSGICFGHCLTYIVNQSKFDYHLDLQGDSIRLVNDTGDEISIAPDELEEYIELDNL